MDVRLPPTQPADAAPPIGEILVEQGLIDRRQLDEALVLQRRWRLRFGEVLMGRGWVRPYDFYRVLADQLRLPFIDLLREPPSPELLSAGEIDRYIAEQCLPWRVAKGVVWYATTDPAEAGPILSARYPGRRIALVVTSKFDILWTVQRRFSGQLTDRALHALSRNDPVNSARQVITPGQLVFGYALISLFLLGLATAPFATLLAANAALSAIYLASLLFKLALTMLSGFGPKRDETVSDAEVAALRDDDLPVYTVLVPMFREPEVLPILAGALRRLDYPISKLDVKLVLEEDDDETIEAAKRLGLESIFEIIRVPPSQPQTKPKACNYALAFARGAFLVIFDAEDKPEPDQLKKAVVAFRKSPANTVCIQAKLNYYNAAENWLTRLFTIDYSLWFDFMLPALDRLRMPIPLGGTSNHFRTSVLRELNAWDPYNVTEDADLGVRLAQKGYRVGVLNSTTFEEANCRLGNWIRQRSRWLKGYMQTYLVQMRRPVHLWRSLGPRGFLGFQLFVGGNIITALANPIFWGIYAVWLATQTTALEQYFPGILLYLNLFNLLIGNIAFIYLAAVSPLRRAKYDLIPYSLTIGFYWVLISVAAYKGLWQLVTKPFYWEKTQHGISRFTAAERAAADAGP